MIEFQNRVSDPSSQFITQRTGEPIDAVAYCLSAADLLRDATCADHMNRLEASEAVVGRMRSGDLPLLLIVDDGEGGLEVTVCERMFHFGARICDPCAEKQQAQAQDKEPTRRERLCPAVHQETNLGRLSGDLVSKGYNDHWLREVMEWQYGAWGLVITGPYGRREISGGMAPAPASVGRGAQER